MRFNLVGVLGFAVQLGVLGALLQGGVQYLAATAIAVEAAILHNFVWHERWTWRDRGSTEDAAGRLVRFHLVNGSVSLAGNLLLMPRLVGAWGVPVLGANLVAVLACGLANYTAANALVFFSPSARPRSSGAREIGESGAGP